MSEMTLWVLTTPALERVIAQAAAGEDAEIIKMGLLANATFTKRIQRDE